MKIPAVERADAERHSYNAGEVELLRGELERVIEAVVLELPPAVPIGLSGFEGVRARRWSALRTRRRAARRFERDSPATPHQGMESLSRAIESGRLVERTTTANAATSQMTSFTDPEMPS
jgi:hypothetical protein